MSVRLRRPPLSELGDRRRLRILTAKVGTPKPSTRPHLRRAAQPDGMVAPANQTMLILDLRLHVPVPR
jgi:hypothetical protein